MKSIIKLIYRGDKSEVLTEDLLNAEKRVDLIRQTCQNSEKKITACVHSDRHIGGVDSSAEKRLKKMPSMQLYQSYVEASDALGSDSLLGLTLSECAKLQHLIGKELLNYETDVEKQCLNALNNIIECDIPNVNKSRKQLNKATVDMDNYRLKYQTSLKLMQQNVGPVATSSAAKTESLKKELEECTLKVDQSRDAYASEMFALLSNESEYARIFLDYYRIQSKYHKKMQELMDIYIPIVEKVINDTPQKPVFGTALEEHLRVNKKEISIVIETCIGWLLNNLNEEGLFRIPGSTSKVKKLKHAFDAGLIDIDEYARDSHTVAGTLKSYLRELPEPLLTSSLYQEWINAAKINDADSRMQALWKVTNKLPKPNFDNLRYLIKFLAKLSNNSDINKMSSQNIAIAISPSVIWTPQQDSSPFDLNMTAANYHGVILDALINYAEWFFPGEVNFVTFPLYEEKLFDGENHYNLDVSSSKGPLVHQRPSKKPAPPIPSTGKSLERKASFNESKNVDSSLLNSSHNFEENETQSIQNNELISTSLEPDVSVVSKESNNTTINSSHSSVIYSTASLDRHTKTADNQIDRNGSSDKKVNSSVQLRNKFIEKPNVPPPSVPHKSERPLSTYERPINPPPERPQRSCDGNKVKQRSLEYLNDSFESETQDLFQEKVIPVNSKSNQLYPSLSEINKLEFLNHSNSNNQSQTSKGQNQYDKFNIAYADDSDFDENDNNNSKGNEKQKAKSIPLKPPRALSPPLNSDHEESGDSLQSDIKIVPNDKVIIEVIHDDQLQCTCTPSKQQIKPPRPQPPNIQKPQMPQKPKIHPSSENTHL